MRAVTLKVEPFEFLDFRLVECRKELNQHGTIKIVGKNGELRYFYRLGEKGAYFQRKQYNPSIAGLSLEGTVKRTERESVFLEMDVERKKGLCIHGLGSRRPTVCPTVCQRSG